MAGKALLDTNIVIGLIGGDPAVLQIVKGCAEVFLPSIVAGELYFGAFKSARSLENLARVEMFLAQRFILACDADTARIYGQIKNALRVKGRPIPDNDIWIAALAAQHGATIITRDQHFREIDSVAIEEPGLP